MWPSCSERSDEKQPGHSAVRAVCRTEHTIQGLLLYRSASFCSKGNLRYHGLAEPHEHCGGLCAGGTALGVQCNSAGAADYALVVGPRHGFLRPCAKLVKVRIPGKIGAYGRVIALALGIAVEDCGKLFPRDRVVRPEQTVTVTAHNIVGCRPGNGAGVPLVIGHIGKSRSI